MEENEGEKLENEEEIRELLRKALDSKVTESSKRKKPSKVETYSTLKGVIGEFLTCYRLFGFDIDGKPITIKVQHNEMEKMAIDNKFMEEFGKFMADKSSNY